MPQLQQMLPAAGPTTPFLSIVMPCLNEVSTVGICIRKANAWLQRAEMPGEVIVVDNGSSDGSAWVARQAGSVVVEEPTRGYGAALRRGFAEARGEWIVMGDCDDTYDFEELDSLLEILRGGADFAIGNRFAGRLAPGAMRWSHRYLGTPAISLLVRRLTGLSVGDSQCGLRAITREALISLNLRTPGMELASEMLVKAARMNLKVEEAPIDYAVRTGTSKLHSLRDGWRHLRFLLAVSVARVPRAPRFHAPVDTGPQEA